jgi:Protein of unknown function (DUF2934)
MGMSLEQVDSSRQTVKPANPRTANDPPIPDIAVNKSVTMERKSTQDREQRIALAAYFIAEQRGFEPGHEMEDWLAAEIQVSQESL